MVDRLDLAVELTRVAEDLDAQLYPYTGVLRRAARALLDTDTRGHDGHPDDRPRCQGCNVRIAQADNGRPRKWCSEPCRRQHRR